MSKLRKKLDTEYEEMVASGLPGKKGVKYAKEHFKREEIKAKEKVDAIHEELKHKQTNKRAYIGFLAKMLHNDLKEVEWPDGWTFQVAPTEVGVVMEIKTSKAKLFRTAFKATGEGQYDFNAVNNFVERCWLLIEKENKNGIVTL